MKDSFSLSLRSGVAHFFDMQRDFLVIENESQHAKCVLKNSNGVAVSTEGDGERLAVQLGSRGCPIFCVNGIEGHC
jgi:hypothetical protein